MSKINSLSDLLMEELADLLDAEKQLIERMPKIAQAGHLQELRNVLEDHRQVSQDQADRIQDIFSNIGQNSQGIVCKTMKGILAELEHVVLNRPPGPERDAAIIHLAQRIEHYEITGYSIAHEHADDLGHTRIVELLDKTLNEERTMHLHLSELAQKLINVQATQAPPSSPKESVF